MAIDVERAFRAHHQGLHRYLVRMTGGDEATARDAVQHAFLRLMEHPPEHGNVKAWLYRVGTNAVFDWSSRQERRASLMDAAATRGDAPGPRANPAPDEELARDERMQQLRAALDALAERDRAILLMRAEGFKHREIARAVGTTTGSVGTMAARALEKLRSILSVDETGGMTS